MTYYATERNHELQNIFRYDRGPELWYMRCKKLPFFTALKNWERKRTNLAILCPSAAHQCRSQLPYYDAIVFNIYTDSAHAHTDDSVGSRQRVTLNW